MRRKWWKAFLLELSRPELLNLLWNWGWTREVYQILQIVCDTVLNKCNQFVNLERLWKLFPHKIELSNIFWFSFHFWDNLTLFLINILTVNIISFPIKTLMSIKLNFNFIILQENKTFFINLFQTSLSDWNNFMSAAQNLSLSSLKCNNQQH